MMIWPVKLGTSEPSKQKRQLCLIRYLLARAWAHICAPRWTLELSLCDRLRSVFFFWNQKTPCCCCKACRALPPPTFRHTNRSSPTCGHSCPLLSALPRLRVSVWWSGTSASSGPIFSTYQVLGDSETAFLPPLSTAFRSLKLGQTTSTQLSRT